MLLVGIFMALLIIIACFRVPVPFAAGLAGMVAMLVGAQSLGRIPSAMFGSLDSFPFLAIPAFILAGDLMTLGGISRALMGWVMAVMGRIKGSIAATVVVSSALFGTISGSAIATVSAIGGMMLPEMLRAGYERKYATALIAASGFIGILIPPSIPGVVYAMTAGVSIADVWMSTFSSGIIITIVFIIYNRIFFAKQETIAEGDFNVKEYFQNVGQQTPKAIVALMMPIIIFVGVYGGILTPTEAGAVAVVYGLIAGWIIYPLLFKEKGQGGLWAVMKKSAVTSGTITLLIAFAAIASTMFTYSGAAQAITDWMLGMTDSKIVFLLIVNMVLLIVGMFLETNTAVLLLGPILIPAAKAFGVDPVHFGAIMLLNLSIGMITPPFACNLFVGCKVGRVTMDQLIKPILGFVIMCIPVLLLITYCPAVPMFFVELFK